MSKNSEITAANSHERDRFGRYTGAFFMLLGAVGMAVLVFWNPPAGLEVFSEPLTIIVMAVLFLLLITIGIFTSVTKRAGGSKLSL